MQRSTIGAVLRSNQAYYQQIAQRETLERGIAYFNDAYPTLLEVNQVREVVIRTSDEISVAFDAVEGFYRSRELKCLSWSPAQGADIAGLGEFLGDHGFVSAPRAYHHSAGSVCLRPLFCSFSHCVSGSK